MALSEDLTAHKGWRVRYLLEGEPGVSDARGLDAVIAPADFPVAGLRRQGRWPLRAALAETAGEGFDLSLGDKPNADTVQRRLSEAVRED